MTGFDAFTRRYGFRLDRFQLDGLQALDGGRSVLVAAPTGAGKTVVGEYAVWRALHGGGKCFYTTPIKALSNQKYRELADAYGAERVGLLTGDRVVNGEAPVVVMTTEVLRNMLYEESRTLDGLQAVVLDEVHYLADRERGAVWEEVIIQLPPEVQLACLSATVSNAEEFGRWLAEVRGGADGPGCDVVITDERPVPLEHHYAFNDRTEPMFIAGGRRGGRKPTAERVTAARRARGGVPNPDIVMLDRQARRSGRRTRRGRQVRGVRLRPPRRSALVASLAQRRWLPAIVFVFSRSGCDKAVDQLMRDGVRLTDAAERSRIRRLAEERLRGLGDRDREVLGFGPWLAGLSAGIAAHHAGLVPAFKETVEELFAAGLLKVCFATETLALGINMPARTVAIERLEKWDGQQHTLLTPGQLTQLTGRAGRRGMDPIGHAVLLHQRDVDFPTVASLVSRRVEPLRSPFQPSYNMAVNLLRRHDRAQAEALLARSFAQWQTDAQVVGDVERIERNRTALEGYAAHLTEGPTVDRDGGGADRELWARRHDELSAETERLAARVRRRTGSLVQRFDRIVSILTDLGYLRRHEGDDPVPTPRGLQLAALYAETDLLLAESLRAGLLRDLDTAELAAVASAFVYETRAKHPPDPVFPTAAVSDRARALEELWSELAAREQEAGLPPTRPADWGFAAAVWRWAGGADLDEAVGAELMTPGDFVRGVKQVADLLRQLRDAVDDTDVAGLAQRANKALVRGVVAQEGV